MQNTGSDSFNQSSSKYPQPSFDNTLHPSAIMQLDKLDHARERYPCCIVWTPLPVITWFLPFIGHTGIGDSNGVLYDFAGPYTIGVGHLSFSKATRYLPLDPANCTLMHWDEGLSQGCETYKHRMHNICFDNCHSHVAKCLNNMGYGKKTNYNMFHIGIMMFFRGRFVSLSAFIRSYAPFAVILTLILLALNGIF